MKLCIYPNELCIGGSPIVAIDLAAAVRDLGHEVIIFATPGPLSRYIEAKGLPFFPANSSTRHPSLSRMRQLIALARRERVDLVHTYEVWPCLDAYFGPHIVLGVPLVSTTLSMVVEPLVPGSLPLVVGTRSLTEQARRLRRGPVHLLEPPINTDADHPSFDGSMFLREHGLDEKALTVVVVSRLAMDPKLDSVERAIDAVALLGAELPVQLAIVGTGETHQVLLRRAEAANRRLDRCAIVLTGAMLDPRPAYAAADVVVGMGSSVLRGMAFGKPAVVQGDKGFARLFSPETAHLFLHDGFYGVGDGVSGPQHLYGELKSLVCDEARRRELGAYSRAVVEERFSLSAMAARLEAIYLHALESPCRPRLSEALPTTARMTGSHARVRLLDAWFQKRRRTERLSLAATGHKKSATSGHPH